MPAKAFPGRAAIILKLLNLTNKNISAIFEKPKSKKIGYYAPGTNIQIKSDQKLIYTNKKIPIINSEMIRILYLYRLAYLKQK